MDGSRSVTSALHRHREPFLLLFPGVAVLLLAFFLPVAQMLVLSVQVDDGSGSGPNCGCC